MHNNQIKVIEKLLKLCYKKEIKLRLVNIKQELTIEENKYEENCRLEEETKYYSREERRIYNKMHKININPDKIKFLVEMYELYNKIFKILESNEAIENDISLLMIADIFNKIYIDNSTMEIRNEALMNLKIIINKIIKEIIIANKKLNNHTPLLDFYDENGNLEKDNILDFVTILKKIYNSKEIQSINSVTSFNKLLDALDQNGLYKNYLEEQQKQELAEQLQKEEQRKQQLELAELKRTENIIKSQNQPSYRKLNPYITRPIDKYLTSEFTLKKNIIDLISYDEFVKILSKEPSLSKKQILEYLLEYKQIYLESKLELIKLSLSEKNKVILENILLFDNNESLTIYNEIINYLFSIRNNFNLEESVTKVSKILEKIKVNHKNSKKNLIIFPSFVNLDEEFAILNNNITALKNISHSFQVLETQKIKDLIKNGRNMFHELKDSSKNNNEPFIIGNLKGYRYGPKKTKICLFNVGVCQENQEILKNLYNLEETPNILLVCGFGNIDCEDEKDLYNRIILRASLNYEELLKIADIFASPFNEETLMIAKSYVDSGSSKKIIKEKIIKKD